jgi:hypothetical protein
MSTALLIWIGLASSPPITADNFAIEYVFQTTGAPSDWSTEWGMWFIPADLRTCSDD